MTTKPLLHTRLTAFLQKRILELRPIKSQAQIASETGYRNANIITMIKNGTTRLPIDRVPSLASSLGVDPRRLLLLALEQEDETTISAFEEIIGTVVTSHELAWIKEIRSASENSDPPLTTRSRSALRAIFGR